jgi:hypothetical protein
MEIRNYILVRDCPPERVAQAVTKELAGQRKWEQVPPETAGVHLIEIVPAADGLTVVDPTTWEGADVPLGQAISKECNATVAVYFHCDEGGSQLAVFSSGRKALAKKSPFAVLADEAVRDFMPLPGSEPITIAFRDTRSERVGQATALIHEHLEPVLAPLGFKPGKIAADSPTTQFVVGYGRRLDDGRSLWVRYCFDKESLKLTLTQDVLLDKERDEHGNNLHDAVCTRRETRFIVHASEELTRALLHRECRLLASQFVLDCAPQIADKLPSLAAEVKAASASAVWQRAAADREELERTRNVARERGPGWIDGTVVFRGAQLLLVQADGTRFTFKLDTSRLPDSKEVAVGELWESWTGEISARKLRMNDAVITFDHDGKLLQS